MAGISTGSVKVQASLTEKIWKVRLPDREDMEGKGRPFLYLHEYNASDIYPLTIRIAPGDVFFFFLWLESAIF